MSKHVIHRPRLAHIQADITSKKKIYETVLKYSKVNDVFFCLWSFFLANSEKTETPYLVTIKMTLYSQHRSLET